MTSTTCSHIGRTVFALATGFSGFVAMLFGAWAELPLTADTVWTNDDTAPIHGRIVQITTDSIVFESVEKPGTSETILRSAIRTWHRSIDPDRLESLHPESPGSYLEYAEELAGLRFDAASMKLSRQLAIIALHLDIEKYGIGDASFTVAIRSLTLLLEIGKDDAEKQRLVRLGIASGLVNHAIDAGPHENDSGPGPSVPDQGEARFLLEHLRNIRRGEFQSAANEQAMARLSSATVDWQFLMTSSELQDCESATNLSAAQMLRLVRLENSIAEYLESGRQPDIDQGWATSSRLPAISVPDTITTRNVTEFDPLQCLWRNGKWVTSDQ